MTALDAVDRALLDRMQSGFPLAVRPFAALGEALGLDEEEVLARVRCLKRDNVIRQIGAQPRRLAAPLECFHPAGPRGGP